jgi:hypothetical protein
VPQTIPQTYDSSSSSGDDDSSSSSSDDDSLYSSSGDDSSDDSSDDEQIEIQRERQTFSMNQDRMYRGPAAGAAMNDLLWPPDKHYLKVRFLNGITWEKDTVKCVVRNHYHAIPMRIRFKFLEKGAADASDIRISFATISNSWIGRDAEKFPKETTMRLNMHPCIDNPEDRRLKRQADILHEFGHALGMMHEHQHPDCSFNWNYGGLQARYGWDAQKVQNNYDRLLSMRTCFGPYDRKSIMHYPIQPGDTHSLMTRVPLNTVLSDGDKKFLASIYPVARATKPSKKPPKPPTKKPLKPPTKKPTKPPSRPRRTETHKKAEPKRDKSLVHHKRQVMSGSGSFVVVQGGGNVVMMCSFMAVGMMSLNVMVTGSGTIHVHGSGFMGVGM